VFTLQNKGSYNKDKPELREAIVVFTLQNKGSYNFTQLTAAITLLCLPFKIRAVTTDIISKFPNS